MSEPLDMGLVAQALNFHGQQLQKVWESDRGEHELDKGGAAAVTFDVFNRRNKHLSFQDRGKRLKLHQFIVRKADALFGADARSAVVKNSKPQPQELTEETENMFAMMPSLETYMNIDRTSRLKYFFDELKVGSLILGTIMSKTQSGMMLKVLCTAETGPNIHYVADINVKAFCPVANIIPAIDRKGVARTYMMNDSVCCEVLETIPDTDKMVCGMKGVTRDFTGVKPQLGLISTDDFPLAYKKAMEHKNEPYESVLEKSVGFNNPNSIAFLAKQMGIESHTSNMKSLVDRFPMHEYASELRQQQASKWAYSNVADGIDHFKAGRHTEAFQCLNKALSIDPRNIEGLVARGALYANNGNFQKAIENFDTALKLNPNHVNARKYMGETLVALGRNYEEENKYEEAKAAYQNCLNIVPYHDEATNSLEFLKNKLAAQQKGAGAAGILDTSGDLLMLPGRQSNVGVVGLPGASTSTSVAPDVNDTLKQLLKNEENTEERTKDKKKKKKSKKKHRRRSNSSSSSSSSNSSDSSSSSSTSSSDSSSSSGDSDFKKRKKSKSSKNRREKQSSLSPLSKRMAMMDPTHETPAAYQFNKPAAQPGTLEYGLEQQHQIQHQQRMPPAHPGSSRPVDPMMSDSYEAKVRAFLDQTKGDEDYEDRVRKFLEESAKWKNKAAGKTDESVKKGSKKKKKEKKAKRESRRKERKKDKKLRRRMQELTESELRDVLKKELGIKDRKKKHAITSDDEEYAVKKTGFLDGLPELDELESKLNAYYARENELKMRESGPSQSPSPTREQKARAAVAEVTALSGPKKWPAHQGASTSAATDPSKFKRRMMTRDQWLEEQAAAAAGVLRHVDVDTYVETKKQTQLQDKSISARKAMAQKDLAQQSSSKKHSEDDSVDDAMANLPPHTMGAAAIAAAAAAAAKKKAIQHNIANNVQLVKPQSAVVLDKFGNFRFADPPPSAEPKDKREGMPPLPPGQGPKGAYGNNYYYARPHSRYRGPSIDGSDQFHYLGGRNKPPEPPGRPRSDSRSVSPSGPGGSGAAGGGQRRSRSRYSRSGSSSGAENDGQRRGRTGPGGRHSRDNSRSGSRSRYSRSRSRSYYSRSRSGSFYSRSRSRSRSYSGDRRRRRGGFRGRFNNDRGTYYKPRFQNPRHGGFRGNRGGGMRDGNYRDRFDHRDYRGGRGRPFFNRERRPRGRFQRGGYRDFRDRRYDRSRSRDRSRSYSVSRSPSPSDRRDERRRGGRDTSRPRDASVPKTTPNTSVNQGGGSGDAAGSVNTNGNKSTGVPSVRHEGPLSEGEDRDDYTATADGGASAGAKADMSAAGAAGKDVTYPSRELYEGKWADKRRNNGSDDDDDDDEERDSDGKRRTDIDDERPPGTEDDIPNETDIAEMERFLNKKKEKNKEEMLQRNKDILKT